MYNPVGLHTREPRADVDCASWKRVRRRAHARARRRGGEPGGEEEEAGQDVLEKERAVEHGLRWHVELSGGHALRATATS
jgi:hypothetical protein